MFGIRRFSKILRVPSSIGSTVPLLPFNRRGHSTAYYNSIISDGHVVRSPFPDVKIPQTSLFSHVFDGFEKFGREIALIDALKDRKITYNELSDKTCRVSSGLRRLGFNKGDVILICAPNCTEYPIIFFATIAAGGIVSTCNPTYTANEISYQSRNSSAKFVATTPELLPTVMEAIKDSPVEKVIVIDKGNSTDEQMVSISSLAEDTGSLFEVAEVDCKNDVAVLPYSSGTTGLPKGVMLSHYNVVSNICQLKHPELTGWSPEDTILGLLPFFHIYGMVIVMFSGLYQGAKIAILPKFEPESFLSSIQKYRVTMTHLVPPAILFLSKHPLVEKYDLSSVKDVMSGAAPLGGEVVKDACSRTGIKLIRQGYGLTETSPVLHGMPSGMGMQKPSSIGNPLPNLDVKVLDVMTGEALGPNKEGEIVTKGPNIMLGYLNHPEATRGCITDDGWFYTGDVGYYDNDGHFYITDRLKELIKVKGFQVAPAELEALLQSHPQIADAGVIGVPNERLGEAPKAFVVVHSNTSLTEGEVTEYVRKNVAEHKWLVGGVQFVEAIPKSASGKILRKNLKSY